MVEMQLYGQFGGYWSNANVSRGIAAGLLANKVRCSLYDRDGLYEGLWGGVERCPKGLGNSLDIGAFVGYPHLGATHLRGHAVKVGFFIAESETLPDEWGAVARQCDLVVVPSSWTRDAYEAAGVPRSKLLVTPHGLHPVFAAPPKALPESRTFLHIAGARDFLDRKGTPQLITAFAGFYKENPDWSLQIRTPPSLEIYRLVGEARCPGITLDAHEASLPPEAMRDYLEQGWAALVQPSRAEAFGICPVEARAVGLPVVLTIGHGHGMHCMTSADVLISMEPAAPIRVNGIPNGTAPDVRVDQIAASLHDFKKLRVGLRDNAQLNARLLRDYFTWPRVMAEVAERIRKFPRQSRTFASRFGA